MSPFTACFFFFFSPLRMSGTEQRCKTVCAHSYFYFYLCCSCAFVTKLEILKYKVVHNGAEISQHRRGNRRCATRSENHFVGSHLSIWCSAISSLIWQKRCWNDGSYKEGGDWLDWIGCIKLHCHNVPEENRLHHLEGKCSAYLLQDLAANRDDGETQK